VKLVIGATGASGTIYLQRLLDQIDVSAHEVHLMMSGHAKQVAAQELKTFKVPNGVAQHSDNDLNVPFVSGSARFDAMIIIPCSMSTLGRIATGAGESALLRAAAPIRRETSENEWQDQQPVMPQASDIVFRHRFVHYLCLVLDLVAKCSRPHLEQVIAECD
jgi:hypothetical protein